MADQRTTTYLDAAYQIKYAVSKGIVGIGSAGNRCQQVTIVGIPYRRASFRHARGAIATVVAVIGAGRRCLSGRLRPIQNARLRIIAIGSRLTQCICNSRKLIAIRCYTSQRM